MEEAKDRSSIFVSASGLKLTVFVNVPLPRWRPRIMKMHESNDLGPGKIVR